MTKRDTILERPVKHCDMSCSGFSVLQRVITRLVLATADPPVQIGRRGGRQDDKKTNRARVRVQVLAWPGLASSWAQGQQLHTQFLNAFTGYTIGNYSTLTSR